MSEVAVTSRTGAPIGQGGESTRAGSTRSAIMEAAERLFHTLGYRKTAVADIARELGMSPANVYRFFPSKGAINEAICARLLSGLAQLCWTIAQDAAPPGARILRLFETVERQTLALFIEDKRMHEMVEAALEEHWGVIAAHVHDVQAALEHIIAEGQAAGLFAASDAAHSARLLRAAMVSFSHPAIVKQSAGEDLAEIASGLAGLLIRGLSATP